MKHFKHFSSIIFLFVLFSNFNLFLLAKRDAQAADNRSLQRSSPEKGYSDKSGEPSNGNAFSSEPNRDLLRDYGLAAFLRSVKFQPGNLKPVSVDAIELIIRSLENSSLKDMKNFRSEFEGGQVKIKHLRWAFTDVVERLGLLSNPSDPAAKQLLADLKQVVIYARNPAWRSHYGKVYNESLKPMIHDALTRGADPLKLAKTEPRKVQKLNQQTQRLDDYWLYDFKSKDGGTISTYLLLPNSDHLLQYRPSELLKKSVVDSVVSMPTDLALFYVASQIVASAEQLVEPQVNPHFIQDSMGMFFNQKTLIDFPEVGYMFAFMGGSRFASLSLHHLLKKGGPDNFAKKLLSGPLQNYLPLAFGSLLASFISDGVTGAYNCSLGYILNGQNFVSPQAQQEHAQNCDLFFDRWTIDKMASKYFGETMRVVLASAAASATSFALNPISTGLKGASLTLKEAAKKSYSGALKFAANWTGQTAEKVVIAGMELSTRLVDVAAASPQPAVRVVGWGARVGHLVSFLAWDRIIEAMIMKRYNSWDLATEADKSENKLLTDFQNFIETGGVIQKTKPIEQCGHPLQRWKPQVSPPSRLLNNKCYDETVFESLDSYASDQKSWRDLQLQKMNASFVAWVDQTIKLVKGHSYTRAFYADFVDQANYRSSALFGDNNPYAGMRGLRDGMNENGEIVTTLVDDNGSLSIEGMKLAQKRNLDQLSKNVSEWIQKIDTPEGREKIFPSQQESSQKMVRDENDKNNLIKNFINNLKFIETGLKASDIQQVKATFSQIWKLSQIYQDYCLVQFNEALKPLEEKLKAELQFDEEKIRSNLKNPGSPEANQAADEVRQLQSALEKEADSLPSPPLCYFAELSRKLGSEIPGTHRNSTKYLEAASNALIQQIGADADHYPKNFQGIPSPNIASYLLTAMACGVDLKEKSTWISQYIPGFRSNNSDRGWEFGFGTDQPTSSSVDNTFGFKANFLSPRLIENDSPSLCSPQTRYETASPSGAAPIPREFDDYRWIIDGQKFTSLTELVATHMYPEIKENGPKKEEENEPKAFKNWWEKNISPSYKNALEVASNQYKRMIRQHFLPAIYGFRAYLDRDEKCEKGLESLNVLPNETLPANSPCSTDEKFVHMYPPKYTPREDLKNHYFDRYKYLPIISAARLELELYLNQLLKPLFIEMFSREKQSNREQMLKYAENIFNYNRNWILMSLEMLMKYEIDQKGYVNTQNLPMAEQWFMFNLLSLQLKMGHVIDSGKINQLTAALTQISLPQKEGEQQRHLELKKLIQKQTGDKNSSGSNAFVETEMQSLTSQPWKNLTEDEKLFAQTVFVKIGTLIKELSSYKRIVDDVKFE